MKLDASASLSVEGRELLVERIERAGWSLTEAAMAAGVSERTARKWRDRCRAEGRVGLLDRSSAPRSVPARTRDDRVQAIGDPDADRHGKLGRLGLEPAQRYERQRPGEPVHIRRQKAGTHPGRCPKRVRDGLRQHYNRTFTDLEGKRRNTVGGEYVHIAVDDATRPGLRRGSRQREGRDCRRVLAPSVGVFARPRASA